MDWLTYISIAALAMGVWHEINRFPATAESLRKLQDRIDDLQSDNEDLQQRLSALEDDYREVCEQVDRIRDPAYWSAIDAKDGQTLYEMDKNRGNV